MKRTIANFCLIGGALTLSACGTGFGDQDLQPPYALERTATYDHNAAPAGEVIQPTYVTPQRTAPSVSAPSGIAPAAPVFQRAQTK